MESSEQANHNQQITLTYKNQTAHFLVNVEKGTLAPVISHTKQEDGKPLVTQSYTGQEIDFSSNGRLEQTTMDEVWHDKWTNGSVINIHRTTVAAYEIKLINGTEYLFMEWKMGNYIYGGMKPSYYVFVRE